MARALRVLLLAAVLPAALPVSPAAAGSLPAEVVVGETLAIPLGSTPELGAAFDFCMKDPTSGSVLRFNSTTGAYVVCGSDGTFEQGVGTITKSGSVTTLSHRFLNPSFNGLESVHASVDSATGHGTGRLNASSETRPSFTPVTIDDPNVGSNRDCSSCAAQSSVSEGAINLMSSPTHAFSLNTTQTEFNVLQKYTLNSDFDGNLTRLVGGLSRNGAGGLSFQMVVYPDAGNQPGSSPLYVSPTFDYSTFPAFPAIGVVHADLDLKIDSTFWAGYRLNPVTNPAYFPYDGATTTPDADVYGCAGTSGSCDKIVLNGTAIRTLFLSADYKHNGLLQSGGLVRFVLTGTTDTVSDKCDGGSYEQVNLGPYGLVQLYAENPLASVSTFPPTDYSQAFARIRRIVDTTGTGLDGKASTRYGTNQRFSAFSFVGGNSWNFCTRLDTTTDYECHAIPGYTAGSGGYTRIAGVTNGFEVSYGNSVADQIFRSFVQYNGSGWTSQTLNPVTASPSIGNPEFGFNWYMARSFKLGVAYEYQKTSGAIEAQLLNGNTVIGKYAVDTDDPPAGFNPNLATRMAGDCTRNGWCAFGRFDSHLKSNVADYIDFTESPPEIQHWVLGAGPQGFNFGRAVSIDARDGKALYGSYSTSSIANQYRLQLDYIDLGTYKRSTLAYDDAAGTGYFPLSLARERGSYGLGLSRGVDTFYSLTENCRLPNFRGRNPGEGSGSQGEPKIPCENLPPIDISRRF